MKTAYTIEYQKGQKKKRVKGFLRIPRDLPEMFDTKQFIEWACKRHNLKPEMGLEIRLHNFRSKNFKYDNAKSKGGSIQKDAGPESSKHQN